MELQPAERAAVSFICATGKMLKRSFRASGSVFCALLISQRSSDAPVLVLPPSLTLPAHPREMEVTHLGYHGIPSDQAGTAAYLWCCFRDRCADVVKHGKRLLDGRTASAKEKKKKTKR